MEKEPESASSSSTSSSSSSTGESSSGKDEEKKSDEKKDGEKDGKEGGKKKKVEIVIPPIKYTKGIELEGFVRLVCVMVLYREGHHDRAMTCAQDLLLRLNSLPVEQRQPLFDVMAKTYYYVWRLLAAKGNQDASSLSRSQFSTALRTAIDIEDTQGIATLINIQLSTFLSSGEYLQASQFLHSVSFPDASQCSSAELARYSYYYALLGGIEGKYKESEEKCQLALNRAPKHALGFRAAV